MTNVITWALQCTSWYKSHVKGRKKPYGKYLEPSTMDFIYDFDQGGLEGRGGTTNTVR